MVDLSFETGQPQIDRLLQGIVAVTEAAFAGRVRGYYLVGSFSDATAVSTSDIDMEIVLKGDFNADDRVRFNRIKQGCRLLSPLHIDLTPAPESEFGMVDTAAIKFTSQCVYGEDIRESIPLPPIPVYLRQISTPTQRGLSVRFRTEQVTLPLAYPLPDDRYYGYIPPRHADDPDSIKLWVLHVGWLATFLVVRHAGIYVPSKRRMLPAYREHINDEWTEFIATVYALGRDTWEYRLPEDADAQQRCRELMAQTLAFENHVAAHYIAYLHEEQRSGDVDLAATRLNAFGM